MERKKYSAYNLKFTISKKHVKENIKFEHSNHSKKRASQRGISSEMIRIVIEYGRIFFKQGCIFYVLGDRMPKICEEIGRNWKKYRNLIVIVSGLDNQIITCYRNNKPFQYIKKKTKMNALKDIYRDVA